MLNCLKSFDTFHFFAMFSSSSLAGTSRGFSFCALYTLSSKETLPPSFAIVFYTVSSALSLVAKCELDMFAITSNVSCQPMSFRSSLVCWMQISNVSRSRHTAVRSACKNYYWQGANVSARVDGFEKNASQSTGRPSPQLVNFCLEWLFTIQLLDLQKRTETTTQLSEVKASWWLEIHWFTRNFSPTKKINCFWTCHCPKGKFVEIWNDEQITWTIIMWP